MIEILHRLDRAAACDTVARDTTRNIHATDSNRIQRFRPKNPEPENSVDIALTVSALLHVRKASGKHIIFGLRCICAIAVMALTSCNWITRSSTGEPHPIAPDRESDVPLSPRSMRPAYRYSVILGGAYSGWELRDAIARDPVVASHYAGFDIAHTVVLRNTRVMLRYVSYRKGEHIAWTRAPLRIPKGELLLSDGSSFARARCGNRLSAMPVRPAPRDGPDVELSIPDVDAPHANSPVKPRDRSEPSPPSLNLFMEPDEQPAFANPNLIVPRITSESLVTGMAGTPLTPFFSIPGPEPSNSVTPVPEPSTRLQVAFTLGFILILALSFRRSN